MPSTRPAQILKTTARTRSKEIQQTLHKKKPDFKQDQDLILDEFPELGWDAIYICGVSSKGYAKHLNYPHNVHIAIIPAPGETDEWSFENWKNDSQKRKIRIRHFRGGA